MLLIFEAGKVGWVGKIKVGGEHLCDPWGMGQRGKGDHSRVFALELGERLGEKKKRCGSSASLLVALTGGSLGLAGGVFWDWG